MNHRARTALAFAAACVPVFGQAPADTAPEWLDKVPPTVTVSPAPGYHRSVFSVSLKADEPATIHVGLNSRSRFETYKRPIAISGEGRTALYYYAVDDFGNKSMLDSVTYVLDTRAPRLSVSPAPGLYPSAVTVTVDVDEPCRVFAHARRDAADGTAVERSFGVTDTFVGFISAVDSAGNRSTVGPLEYVVATSRSVVQITPRGGRYNVFKRFKLTATPPCSLLYYTFDDLALPENFTVYRQATEAPYGKTIVRYYGIDSSGWRTRIEKSTFVVDTIPPRVRIRHVPGPRLDTIYLVSRDAARIYYATGSDMPRDDGPVYDTPVVVQREGLARVRAVGIDLAGNVSSLVTWERQYDRVPPRLKFSSYGGRFSRPTTLRLTTNEPSRVFCTVDGSQPDTTAAIYEGDVEISAHGRTLLRCVAVDRAGNMSTEQSAVFVVDTARPVVKSRIDGSAGDREFTVTLTASEDARIHYALGSSPLSTSSPVYRGPLKIKPGQSLRYLAVDKAGNRSREYALDDLKSPKVAAVPEGGAFTYPVGLTFTTSIPSAVYYRLLPDTAFTRLRDTLHLRDAGQYTIDYYAETPAGRASPVRREQYDVDPVPPVVKVSMKRGAGDSAIVLFEASENATIYYTLDGTSPYGSGTVRTAAGKRLRSRDRITVQRRDDIRLAFYAEDRAGNQSRLSVLDLFKPRAIPNLPDGPDIVYDRALSVELNTYDEGRIYYARHAKTPTVDSSVYREPVTLVRSDTICAFAVDQSGVVGAVDTFIYLIDLPPIASFATAPEAESLLVGETVTLDASGSRDNESPVADLLFRWDFDGDGAFDTEYARGTSVSHVYREEGLRAPVVEVRDPRGRQARFSREVVVRRRCPEGMVFAADGTGHTFCIDRYEWPNEKGAQPQTDVSWVEAKMHCFDAGKRLCTAYEWETACRGRGAEPYPYGVEYQTERCASEGKEPHRSGSFDACGEGFGTRDMVGNVWEWVEDKRDVSPLHMGGTYRMGRMAHCGLRGEGRVSTTADDIGFRCCK